MQHKPKQQQLKKLNVDSFNHKSNLAELEKLLHHLKTTPKKISQTKHGEEIEYDTKSILEVQMKILDIKKKMSLRSPAVEKYIRKKRFENAKSATNILTPRELFKIVEIYINKSTDKGSPVTITGFLMFTGLSWGWWSDVRLKSNYVRATKKLQLGVADSLINGVLVGEFKQANFAMSVIKSMKIEKDLFKIDPVFVQDKDSDSSKPENQIILQGWGDDND